MKSVIDEKTRKHILIYFDNIREYINRKKTDVELLNAKKNIGKNRNLVLLILQDKVILSCSKNIACLKKSAYKILANDPTFT